MAGDNRSAGDAPLEARARPNIFSIPAGVPFLETLAEAIRHDRLGLELDASRPEALATLTIYVPTRRAARGLAAELLRQSGSRALILPRLVPLGDPGEAEMQDLMGQMPDMQAVSAGPLPINALSRQLLLARQIQHASQAQDMGFADQGASGGSFAASTLGSAFRLAGDLAAILDAMQAEDVPYDRLLTLDAARFDELWQLTARFLAILGEHWPAILADRGEVDPVLWRNRLLAAQASRLETRVSGGPVLVAGSTGSMPATARLMSAVSRLRRGAVVLPDLDLDMSEADWSALSATAMRAPDRLASHPQAQLLKLLQVMVASRADVRVVLPSTGTPHREALAARRQLVHEALRAADTSEAWQTLPQRVPVAVTGLAMAGVRILEAPDERLEGLAVALAIKHALHEPGRTVALVTPDRGLAERVALELGRWGIIMDDSAGQPLHRTHAGHALLALAEVLVSGATAETVLELLHQPVIRLGLELPQLAHARQALEIGALRGVRTGSGMAGLESAIAAMPERIADHRAPRCRQRLDAAATQAASDLVTRLADALSPLVLPVEGRLDLGRAICGLRLALERMTCGPDGTSGIFLASDGEALQALLGDLETACLGTDGTPDDLALICRTAMADRVVRARRREHPRVLLLGLLEARLMPADLMILGGLNETVWPPQTTTDPFLNRAMRAEIGLSSPERRIGQSAHDFIQGFCADHVILSRSVKLAGVQTLPSRFWQRLKAVAPQAAWQEALRQGEDFVTLARGLDRPAEDIAIERPRPRPDKSLQPSSFSVSEAENLLRDPYAIFAKRILDLQPLEPLQVVLGAADRGTLLHDVMDRFARRWPAALPDEPIREMRAIGEAVFADVIDEPDVQGFWWPRFVDLIPAIVAWEQARRGAILRVGTELRIKLPLRLPDGAEVSLSARADRIEERLDGTLAVLDFKTGTPPSKPQIKAGLAPQLLLESAMGVAAPFTAKGMGVTGATSAPVSFGPAVISSASYVALKADADGLQSSEIATPAELARLSAECLAGFTDMVAGFRCGERPFTSRFAPQFMRYAGDFDHLARVKEWSLSGEGADEDSP